MRCNRHRLDPSPSESILAHFQIVDKITNAINIEDITQQNLETAEVEEILHSCNSVYQPTEQDVILLSMALFIHDLTDMHTSDAALVLRHTPSLWYALQSVKEARKTLAVTMFGQSQKTHQCCSRC